MVSQSKSISCYDMYTVRQPLLLVGAERSGSTLLRLMMDGHSRIAFHKEFEFAVDKVGDDGTRPNLPNYVDWLRTVRNFNNTGLQIDKSLSSYDELIHSFLRQKQANKANIGATVHRHLLRLRYLFSDAYYLHLLRDPRDVALSNVAMGWAGNAYHGVNRWIEIEREWDQLVKTLPRSRWIEVHYEELVVKPVAVLQRICDWIGEAYDPAMLDYPLRSTYGAPHAGTVRRWRKQLNPVLTRLLETKIGHLLESRGYERSGLPPLVAAPYRRYWLAFQDWLGRARFRIKRYGPSLFLANYVACRVGPSRFSESCRRRMLQIDNAYVK